MQYVAEMYKADWENNYWACVKSTRIRTHFDSQRELVILINIGFWWTSACASSFLRSVRPTREIKSSTVHCLQPADNAISSRITVLCVFYSQRKTRSWGILCSLHAYFYACTNNRWRRHYVCRLSVRPFSVSHRLTPISRDAIFLYT